MKALQQQWGYPVSSDTGGMEHETMGMANDMAAMSTEAPRLW